MKPAGIITQDKTYASYYPTTFSQLLLWWFDYVSI